MIVLRVMVRGSEKSLLSRRLEAAFDRLARLQSTILRTLRALKTGSVSPEVPWEEELDPKRVSSATRFRIGTPRLICGTQFRFLPVSG